MKISYKIHTSETNDAFGNSREALKSLLAEEGFAVVDLRSDLELINFQTLRNYPGLLTSLSHTKYAGAALLAKSSEVIGLGIDIEWADRPMKTEASKYFVHQNDKHDFGPLELWCAKEAAFKALSPLGYTETLLLSKIVISRGSFFAEKNPSLIGEVQIAKSQIKGRQLIVATAHIKA